MPKFSDEVEAEYFVYTVGSRKPANKDPDIPVFLHKLEDADGHRPDLGKDDAAFLNQFNAASHALMIILQSVELKKGYWFIPPIILSLQGIIRLVNSQMGTVKSIEKAKQ